MDIHAGYFLLSLLGFSLVLCKFAKIYEGVLKFMVSFDKTEIITVPLSLINFAGYLVAPMPFFETKILF